MVISRFHLTPSPRRRIFKEELFSKFLHLQSQLHLFSRNDPTKTHIILHKIAAAKKLCEALFGEADGCGFRSGFEKISVREVGGVGQEEVLF